MAYGDIQPTAVYVVVVVVVVFVVLNSNNLAQCVVTGQAPITLERKITSGGKQILVEAEDNTHNN